MLKFTAEQIQAQFEKLPQEVKDAVTSAEIHDSIITIANNRGLHVDQEGILVDLVGQVMLGLSPSKDFVRNFSSETGIDAANAKLIAEDVNKEVFGKIRTSMRQLEEKDRTDEAISSLEQAGNFTVESEENVDNNGSNSRLESKKDIISNIENPVPAKATNNTEPLVDRLLSGPVITVEKKTRTSDLYREPIE